MFLPHQQSLSAVEVKLRYSAGLPRQAVIKRSLKVSPGAFEV